MSGKDDKQFKKELKNQTYIYNFRVKFDEDKVQQYEGVPSLVDDDDDASFCMTKHHMHHDNDESDLSIYNDK